MNSHQVEANFDVLADQKKALINQPNSNHRVNSVDGLDDNEQAMTMSEFTSK